MKTKKFFIKWKHFNHKKIVAIVFLIAMFYVGSATFPLTLKSIIGFLNDEYSDILSSANQIDDEYRNMLGFSDNNLRNKGFYINLNGLMARIMGQRYMNERVKLDNGHLTTLGGISDISRSATQLTKLHMKQIENGKTFLFVLAPYQIPIYEDIVPTGYKDSTNQVADDLLFALRENGVPLLDLREEMFTEGINHSEAFFITDHHWKPETGFWAYTKIIDYLVNTKTIDPVPPKYTDIDAYNVDTFRDFFLGSHGKRTGIYFAGIDDFSVIVPKFETDISINIPSKELNKRGEFAEIAFDKSRLRLDYFSENPYAAYNHGSAGGYRIYHNDAAPVDANVLAIGDSFSVVPFTFLPLVFNTSEQLDMRSFEGDFEEYFYSYDPDIVIVLINPTTIKGRNATYDFFNDFIDSQMINDELDDE